MLVFDGYIFDDEKKCTGKKTQNIAFVFETAAERCAQLYKELNVHWIISSEHEVRRTSTNRSTIVLDKRNLGR